jgi:hypothetical protein
MLPAIDNGYQPKMLSHIPDFIIDSLCQTLIMQPSQATALLAGHQKFLIYLCVKGMTGKDYTKLINWYTFLFDRVANLVQLLQIEDDNASNVWRAMNVVKCGLYSHNLGVAVECSRLINRIWEEVRDLKLYRVQQHLYDWFTTN